MGARGLVAVVVLVVGIAMLVQGARVELLVRRGEHTRGRIVSARRAHLSEDGRRFWDIQVSYSAGAGEVVTRWVRQMGRAVDERIGEEVDVWFDPHRPDKARIALAENAAGPSWVQYAIGLALVVGGSWVLVARPG